MSVHTSPQPLTPSVLRTLRLTMYLVCIFLYLYCAYVLLLLEWRNSSNDSSEAQQNGCSDVTLSQRIRHRTRDHCKSIQLTSTQPASIHLIFIILLPTLLSFSLPHSHSLTLALTHFYCCLALSCPVFPLCLLLVLFFFLFLLLSFFVVLSCLVARGDSTHRGC